MRNSLRLRRTPRFVDPSTASSPEAQRQYRELILLGGALPASCGSSNSIVIGHRGMPTSGSASARDGVHNERPEDVL